MLVGVSLLISQGVSAYYYGCLYVLVGVSLHIGGGVFVC